MHNCRMHTKVEYFYGLSRSNLLLYRKLGTAKGTTSIDGLHLASLQQQSKPASDAKLQAASSGDQIQRPL